MGRESTLWDSETRDYISWEDNTDALSLVPGKSLIHIRHLGEASSSPILTGVNNQSSTNT